MLLNFVDKNFDIKRLAHYRLSIQISLNGFSFCVFDNVSSKHVLLRHYQYQHSIANYDDLSNEVSTILSSDNYLKQTYDFSSCIYLSTKHTLIPSSAFAKEKLRSYLEFITPLDELDEIHYKQFGSTGIYSIFTLPSPIVTQLVSHYNNILFFNQFYLLMYACENKDTHNALFINLHDGIASLMLKVENQLKLHNSFDIIHLNDAIYYINAIIQQFQLQRSLLPIYISGDILREEIDELTKYFPLLKVENNYRMSMLVGYENSYRYYTMLMAHECV